MFFISGIWNGLGEVRAHKLRSLLTVTCVALGVASLVLIAGFITGLFDGWEGFERAYGMSQRVEVGTERPKGGPSADLSPGQTMADVRAITRASHYLEAVSAGVNVNGSLTYAGNTSRVGVEGVTPGKAAVSRYTVERGRFVTDVDVDRASQVIVLGSEAAKDLFKGRADPMGQVVQVGGQPFRVVGLLPEYRQMDGGYNYLKWKNRVAFVPVTAAQRRVTGQATVDEITLRVDDAAHLSKLTDEATSVLRSTHRGVHDFTVENRQEGMAEQAAMRRNFYVVGCGVGVITLLVGGIGIMNLMLASINERVREIGIRKAIGAWNRDIFVQFVAEAIALSMLGGISGVVVGVLVVRALRHTMGTEGGMSPPVVSVEAVGVGLAFSVAVGIVAGIYPAVRASRLDPIEALRYE